MIKMRNFLIVLIAFLAACFLVIFIIYNHRQNISIQLLDFPELGEERNIRGYRFILRNDGTLVSQYGVLRRNHGEGVDYPRMIFTIRRTRTILTKQEVQEISELVHRISEVYANVAAQILADYEYWPTFDDNEEGYFYGGEYVVFSSSRQRRLMYDGNIYGVAAPLEALFRLVDRLHQLSL